MTKNNYLNQRYHRNEKTLFLNPTKSFRNKKIKPNSSGLSKYLILVTIIFSLLIAYSAYAEESSLKNGWEIEVDNEIIAIRREGIVTHGDNILFVLSKSDCNKMSWFTKFYTMERSVKYDDKFKVKLEQRKIEFDPILDKHLIFQIKNTNDTEDIGYTTAEVMNVNVFLSGHRAFIYFGTYDTSRYLQWFRSGDIWEFKMVQATEYLINSELNGNKLNEEIAFVNPIDYFDIPMNSWDFEGFNEIVMSAQKQCEDMSIIALS